jgi:hypothetical protein
MPQRGDRIETGGSKHWNETRSHREHDKVAATITSDSTGDTPGRSSLGRKARAATGLARMTAKTFAVR